MSVNTSASKFRGTGFDEMKNIAQDDVRQEYTITPTIV